MPRMTVEVFCSYAREDEPWLRKIETHLSLLERQKLISLWNNQQILPGMDQVCTNGHLETASIILLLISADFIASDYCYSVEMKHALARQEAGESQVIPILVRPVDWHNAPFAHLQPLPSNAKPLATWENQEMALVDIAVGIRRVIENLSPQPTNASQIAPPPIWNIPLPPNMYFTGRDSVLNTLHQLLTSGSMTALTQALSGLGGIGKTATAIEYAYRFRNSYERVFWTNADSQAALTSEYVKLADKLRLVGRNEQDLARVVDAVKNWLGEHDHWLLVLDNVEDIQIISSFLPISHQGSVLITTRVHSVEPLAQTQILSPLPEHEGILFLLRRTKELSLDAELKQASMDQYYQARQIWQTMDGLPLALDQAGAYILETSCSFASYREQFEHQRDKLLARRGKRFIGHEASIAATFSLLFDRVKSESLLTADILSLCSLFHNEAIPEELFFIGAQQSGSLLALSEDEWNEAVGMLLDHSLVQRNTNAKMLTIHRLVQAVLLNLMPEQERVQRIERIITAMHQIFPSVADETQKENANTSWVLQGERLILHVLTLIKHILPWNAIRQDLAFPFAQLLYDLACYLSIYPRPTEATSLYEQVLRIHQPAAGILLIQEGLAVLYQKEGKYREAELHFLSCLRAAEPIPVELSDWKANLLHNLAICYESQGRHEEAAQFLQRSSRIERLQETPLTLRKAKSMHNLAIVYKNQGRYKEAEQLHRRVLHFREQALGFDHSDVSVSLSSLAVLYLEQERFSEAEALFQRALHIKERVFGPAHSEIVSSMFNLANLYAKRGRLTEAEALYRRGLLIWEQALGANHPDVALILRSLAATYGAQGKYGEAEQLCQRALTIYEQAEHQDASIARDLLAAIRRRMSIE